jgi:Tol biopolymer transport system component
LVVDQAAGMMAAPFDAAHPARTSADTTVLANVYYELETESRGWLSISNTGTAVYAPGNPAKRSLVWVDREGKIELLGKDQDVYREASLSPDGAKAVVRHGLDLWIHDLQRGARSPLTSGNANNLLPLWSRDGRRIIFASNRGGDWDIYSQPADGSRPAEALLKRPYDQYPCSILADGTVLYREIHPKTGRDLWTLSPDGKTSPLRVTPFNETDGQFSPGPAGGPRWVAYSSDESGRSEIYVQSYPGGENRMPVSNGGGTMPRWSRDGKELFYATGDAVVAVAIRPDGSFGAPRRLFDRSNYFISQISVFNSYDVSPDGKRFLMIQRDPGSVPRQLNVILNWSDARDRSVPDGRRDERSQ